MIDLPEVNLTGAQIFFNPGTGFLEVTSGGATFAFMLIKPSGIDFVLQSNGSGGTEIVLGEGVTITGTDGADRIDAKHTVAGRAAADEVRRPDRRRRGGADRVSGLAGNDWIIGGKGRDVLKGGSGDDRIEGGAGRNKIKGGNGVDTFVFAPDIGDAAVGEGRAKAEGACARARLRHRSATSIELDADVFLAIGPTLDEGEFRLGRKAKDEDDHLLYHAKSGRLLYRRGREGRRRCDRVRPARQEARPRRGAFSRTVRSRATGLPRRPEM